MSAVVWHWEPLGGRSRTAGNTGGDGLIDSNLDIAELVAREITQNSDDAMDFYRKEGFASEHEPSLTFRFVELRGSDKARVIETLNLRELRTHAPHVNNPRTDLDMMKGTCLGALDDPSPLRVMYVEEYGAVGLIGNPITQPETSRWYHALISQGLSYHEDSDTQTGGTFGFGKAAFQLGSLLGMVVAYSHFEPLDGDGVTRRLGGYLYQHHHRVEADGPYYTGFAQFGVSAQAADGPTTRPYEDGEADDLAAVLGMGRLTPEDVNRFGTTFMIVDPSITPTALTRALELYWWPAIRSHSIAIDVVDYDGSQLPPQPLKRQDLRPFLECWSLIDGLSSSGDEFAELKTFNRLSVNGVPANLGKLAVVADRETCFERGSSDADERSSQVALVRQRKMVVEYHELFRDKPPFVSAVLFTDSDIELHVAKSEPKTHDRWWLATRERVKPEWPEDRKLVIRTLFSRTYETVSAFRSRLRVTADEDTLRLDRLSRLLGSLLRTRGKRGKRGVAPTGGAPITLRMPGLAIRRTVDAAGLLTYTQPVTVSVNQDAGFQEVDAEVSVLFSIEEDTGVKGDKVPTLYSLVPDGWAVDGDVIRGRLTPSPISFEAQTAPIDGPFAVNIDGVVRIDRPEATEEQAE